MKKMTLAILTAITLVLSACGASTYQKPTLDELNRGKAVCNSVAVRKACPLRYSAKICYSVPLRKKLVNECLQERYGWANQD